MACDVTDQRQPADIVRDAAAIAAGGIPIVLDLREFSELLAAVSNDTPRERQTEQEIEQYRGAMDVVLLDGVRLKPSASPARLHRVTPEADEPASIHVEICEGVDSVEAIQAAEAIAGIVDDPGAVKVVVTDDLDAAARQLLGDAARERDVQRAWAKTAGITIGDTIVIAADCFGQGHYHAYVASHEALHLALAQRGESTHDIRGRVPEDASSTDLVVLAGIASEEYRVELALTDRFSGANDGLAEGFPSVVGDFARLVAEAFENYQQTLDTAALMEVVGGRFQELLNMTAYLTTSKTDEQLATIAEVVPPDIASRVLGAGWKATVTALRRLPSADVRTTRNDIDQSVIEVADALDDWLAQIGFSMTDEDNGSVYFAVLEPEAWRWIHEGFGD